MPITQPLRSKSSENGRPKSPPESQLPVAWTTRLGTVNFSTAVPDKPRGEKVYDNLDFMPAAKFSATLWVGGGHHAKLWAEERGLRQPTVLIQRRVDAKTLFLTQIRRRDAVGRLLKLKLARWWWKIPPGVLGLADRPR